MTDRELLEAAQAALDAWDRNGPHDLPDAMRNLRAALAQPEPEPEPEPEPVCRCNMRTRLVGDGCAVCNPALAAEIAGDEQATSMPVTGAGAPEDGNWVSEDEYARRVDAALALWPRDCRTCAHFTTASVGCTSVVQCVDSAQFKATAPRQYWLSPT